MKELVNQESIKTLKKSRKYIFICIIISVVVFAGIMASLFFLVNRNNRFLFNVIFAIITTVEATAILYMLAVCLFPLNHYIKICSLSLYGNKYATIGKVQRIPSEKVSHYRGVAVREVLVLDIEENKEYKFFVEQNCKEEFEEGKVYKFITYQSVIVAYDENL